LPIRFHAADDWNPALAAAYAECQRLARRHYENFPVASWLLPVRMRPHIAAVYAFARTADDLADEGQLPSWERMRLLDDWQHRLHACAVERRVPPLHLAETSAGLVAARAVEVSDRVFLALGATIRACNLPLSLFDDLLSAFRQDITTHRYDTWQGVLDYCRHSADPVGRLVLRIAGYHDPDLDRSSDALCTALQLTNFWQDLDRDWQNGRLYVPLDDIAREQARLEDLDSRRPTEEWRRVMHCVGARTRDLFAAGRAVCDGVSGRLRHELRLTWLGGMRILERLDQVQYDTFSHRPTLGVADAPTLLWRAWAWPPAIRRVASEKA
jgi:phytoene synthase